jgi:hypothetical protein
MHAPLIDRNNAEEKLKLANQIAHTAHFSNIGRNFHGVVMIIENIRFDGVMRAIH